MPQGHHEELAGSLVADKHDDDTDGWDQPWWSTPQAVEHIGSVKVLLGTASEDKVGSWPRLPDTSRNWSLPRSSHTRAGLPFPQWLIIPPAPMGIKDFPNGCPSLRHQRTTPSYTRPAFSLKRRQEPEQLAAVVSQVYLGMTSACLASSSSNQNGSEEQLPALLS